MHVARAAGLKPQAQRKPPVAAVQPPSGVRFTLQAEIVV